MCRCGFGLLVQLRDAVARAVIAAPSAVVRGAECARLTDFVFLASGKEWLSRSEIPAPVRPIRV